MATVTGAPALLFIGGSRVPAADGATFDTFDPSPNDLIRTVPKAGLQAADRAPVAARTPFYYVPLRALSAVALGDIRQEAWLPAAGLLSPRAPGVVMCLALARHAWLDKVGFTGVTATGKQVLRAATDPPKGVSLELGGKSPNVV